MEITVTYDKCNYIKCWSIWNLDLERDEKTKGGELEKGYRNAFLLACLFACFWKGEPRNEALAGCLLLVGFKIGEIQAYYNRIDRNNSLQRKKQRWKLRGNCRRLVVAWATWGRSWCTSGQKILVRTMERTPRGTVGSAKYADTRRKTDVLLLIGQGQWLDLLF